MAKASTMMLNMDQAAEAQAMVLELQAQVEDVVEASLLRNSSTCSRAYLWRIRRASSLLSCAKRKVQRADAGTPARSA